MAKYEATESDFELIPIGTIVSAKVKKISDPEEYQGRQGPFKKVKWVFQITEGQFNGWTIHDATSDKFSVDPKSKMVYWAEAITGNTYAKGDPFDTDDLLGMPCRLEIGHSPDRNDPDKTWHRVETLMPPRSAASAEDVFG